MKHVFFIDDDEMLRDLFPRVFRSWRRFWSDADVRLHVADSTARLFDLLNQVAEEDAVLFITDGNMRGSRGFDLDGDELIEAVRAGIGERLVRVVIMTGRPEEFQAASDRLGAELLAKPADPDALKRIVTEFVEN